MRAMTMSGRLFPEAANNEIACETAPSPFGELLLLSQGDVLTGLYFDNGRDRPVVDPAWRRSAPVLREACAQLRAYFAGRSFRFDLPLALAGTAFQRSVWSALCDIPCGETISYVELARRVGSPKAFRAAGQANGANPVAIVVPCHRVIAADGSLGGYGGGLDRKRWLLDHERPQRGMFAGG